MSDKLAGIHPDLRKLWDAVILACPYKLICTEGLRTLEAQKANVAKGVSQTLKSRHLTGHAVDFAVLDEKGKVTWDFDLYHRTAYDYFKPIAAKLGIPIVWGGDWHSLKDGCHIELERNKYP